MPHRARDRRLDVVSPADVRQSNMHETNMPGYQYLTAYCLSCCVAPCFSLGAATVIRPRCAVPLPQRFRGDVRDCTSVVVDSSNESNCAAKYVALLRSGQGLRGPAAVGNAVLSAARRVRHPHRGHPARSNHFDHLGCCRRRSGPRRLRGRCGGLRCSDGLIGRTIQRCGALRTGCA